MCEETVECMLPPMLRVAMVPVHVEIALRVLLCDAVDARPWPTAQKPVQSETGSDTNQYVL